MNSGIHMTILIGSCARGTDRAHSDVDIVRVGHGRQVSREDLGRNGWAKVAQGPIAYVDYDFATFAQLFAEGSLFVHHILGEGILLSGSPAVWDGWRAGFRVAGSFHQESARYLASCFWFLHPERFVHARLPFLSHLFRAMKNAAIFSLADRHTYCFEKHDCLQRAFPSMTDADIELLLAADAAYQRSSDAGYVLAENQTDTFYSDFCGRVAQALASYQEDE
jgi:hypothetical protein